MSFEKQDNPFSAARFENGVASVVVDGPLGEILCRELNEKYAKEIDRSSGLALETQSLDTTASINDFVLDITTQNQKGASSGYVYVTSDEKIDHNDVYRVADVLGGLNEKQLAQSAVLVIGCESMGLYASAMKNITARFGVPTYTSVKDYARTLR